MSDEAMGGILQALEPRLAEIERRQDDLDVVVLEMTETAAKLTAERDDARAAAQVQADEIARLTWARDAIAKQRDEYASLLDRWREKHAEATTVLITCDREIARMTAELQRAHEAGERMRREYETERQQHHNATLAFGEQRERALKAEADLAAAVKRATALESANALGSAQVTQLQEELAATTAKLGRAVALIKAHQWDGAVYSPARESEVAAILTDADSADAGNAYSELVAVYEAAKLLPLNGHGGNCTCAWCALNAALARVDAWRGGGR